MEKEMRILVLNVGSSSIKYVLFKNSKQISSENYERLKTKEDYKKTIEKIFGKINNLDAIAHRVVHGGDLTKPSLITKQVKEKIRKFSEFAPLHNPKQLMVIELCEKYKKPQYAVFDTMFFSELPEIAKTYAIPFSLAKKFKIKKYGFHGLSHESVLENLKGKTITCHLGSGTSISAILNSKPIDTSMGFTPSEGLIMGTRSGTIDPGIIFFLEKKGYNTSKILTEDSGLKGISGFNDFRDILSRMKTNKHARLAYDMYLYQIIKTIGSYAASLDGLNNLVFTAKIGENVPKLRQDVCSHLSLLGIEIDKNKNEKNKELISSGSSKVKVYVRTSKEEEIIIKKLLKIL